MMRREMLCSTLKSIWLRNSWSDLYHYLLTFEHLIQNYGNTYDNNSYFFKIIISKQIFPVLQLKYLIS